MFSVKIVARPDARMVEVPLELEAELPREFDGQAVLASSGVPRKVKLKAPKDALKLSTAYRADVLLVDIARVALKASPADLQKIQEATQRFVRLVRERRQDGATLTISSNGRGKLEVQETGTGLPAQPGARTPSTPPTLALAETGAAREGGQTSLEKRIAQLEAALPQLLEGAGAPQKGAPEPRLQLLEDKVRNLEAQQILLEQRLEHVHGELVAAEADSAVRGGELQRRVDGSLRVIEERMADARQDDVWRGKAPAAKTRSESETPLDSRRGVRRSTAVDAFADGLRAELRGRVAAALQPAGSVLEKIDRAAALAAEGSLSLGAPASVTAELRTLSSQAAARHKALERLGEESDFYKTEELPVAALLLDRLEKEPAFSDPLELLRKSVVSAGEAADEAQLAAWLSRAAALCGDELVQALPGEPVQPEMHDAARGSEARGHVVRTVAPGVRSANKMIRRPRIESTERSATPPQGPAPAPALAPLPAEEPPPQAAPPAAAPAPLPSTPAVLAEEVVEIDDAEELLDAPEAEALPELEPISGPISAPVALEPAPLSTTAAADLEPKPPGGPPARPPGAQGDLWNDVSSDDAWAAIKLETPAEGVDPWAPPAEKPPKAAAPADEGGPAKP